MKKSKKIIIISIIVIIALAVIAGGIFVFERMKQEALLIGEANTVAQLNILEEEIDMSIKTKGDYAVVEKAMKEYIRDVANDMKNIVAIYSNEEIINFLDVENIKKDGPKFTDSLAKIATAKQEANTYSQKITTALQEESMMNKIKEQNVSKYYVELFEKVMYGQDGTKEELEKAGEEIRVAQESYSTLLGYIEETLLFLRDHSSSWKLQGSQILFYNQKDLDEYQAILKKIIDYSQNMQ